MAKLYNLARMTTATTGTGTITLGSAVSGYLTFAQAGISNADVVSYAISDGANSEIGTGTYTSAGTTLTRTVTKSTNSNTAINLSGSAQVFITPRAEDLNDASILTSGTTGTTVVLGNGVTATTQAIGDNSTKVATTAYAQYMALIPPQGRLTLTSNTPVMTATASGQTTIYYTPYIGRFVPIYDGTRFVLTDTGGQLSQTTTDTTKSPAATGTFGSATNVPACYDMFVWNDSGTIRCTRGPGWTYSSTVTMTIATPCVVSWTSHGLSEGMAVVLTTTGALPTGLSANTVYYVGRSPGTNSFNLSTSVANAAAGTFIATSGSQSGTHTMTCYVISRGTGAGTTELQLLNGFYTNKNAITNGPSANQGTYVGTVLSNTSSSIDWIFGARSSGGTAGVFGVWNAYNRVLFSTSVQDSSASWTYATNTWQPLNAGGTGSGLNNRVTLVNGLQVDYSLAIASISTTNSNNGTTAGSLGLGLNSTNSTAALSENSESGYTGNGLLFAKATANNLGYYYFQELQSVRAGTLTYNGSGGTGTFVVDWLS